MHFGLRRKVFSTIDIITGMYFYVTGARTVFAPMHTHESKELLILSVCSLISREKYKAIRQKGWTKFIYLHALHRRAALCIHSR